MKLFLVSRKVSAETVQERATPTPTMTSPNVDRNDAQAD